MLNENRWKSKPTAEVFGDMPPVVDAPIRKSPKDMSDTEILQMPFVRAV